MTENSRKNHTLHLENGNWAEDMGSVFLATVAASAQTFFLLLSFSFFLFPCEAALTHDINLYCYTHQCWFIAALVWRKRQDERFCRDGRRLGKRQRWGKASLIVFVVFFYFLHFFSFFFFSYTSASTVWLSRLFLGLTPRLDSFFFFFFWSCFSVMMTLYKVPKPLTSAPPPFLLHRCRHHPSARFIKGRISGRWSKRVERLFGMHSVSWMWSISDIAAAAAASSLPSAFHSVSHSLPVYLPVCLSLCLLYGGLGSSPVWAACHHWGYSMYSLPCASYLFFLLVLFCLSPFHVVVFFSFFSFFLISAWRLLFDSLCWAKACRWRLEQGGELWLSHFWAHLKDHNVIVHEIVAAPFIVSMPQLKSTAELLQ